MLKIIADDLGLHKSVNDGIIFLLKEGKIDGTSLMANGEAFEDAVEQCIDARLSNIGVHLNLVEQVSVISGKPLSKSHRIFFVKYILGLIAKDVVREELKAQIEKVIRTGIKPFFLNGNQHLHLLPGIMDIVIDLAKKHNISYIRVVNEPVNLFSGKFSRKLQLLFLNFLSVKAKKKIQKTGLQCNDYFIGFVSAGSLSHSDIKFAEKLVAQYPDKIIELGCHPGSETEGFKNKYSHWGNYNWRDELELLKND